MGTSIATGQHSCECLLAHESWDPNIVPRFSLVTFGGSGVSGLWNEPQSAFK